MYNEKLYGSFLMVSEKTDKQGHVSIIIHKCRLSMKIFNY